MFGRNLPEFHPLTVLREWEGGKHQFRLADALTGVCGMGATGSGKSSGPAKNLAYGYLAANFGGLVLCAKKEERRQWEAWAQETGRASDLIIIDARGKWRFNFLDWEASRPGEGAGLTMNIVSLLDEIAGAIAGRSGEDSDGSGRFFADALHYLNLNLVELVNLAGEKITLPLLRSILLSAPQTVDDLYSEKWQKESKCAQLIRQAYTANATADEDTKADLEECRNYWLNEYPVLSEKTRSIITLTFSMLVRPFITRPLRRLFSSPDSTVTPEDTFQGRIIIVDLPIQEYRLAGRVAALAWKYCFQVAVLRRSPPTEKDAYLRPVFLWWDEGQNFLTPFDTEWHAVARSAGGCSVMLVQTREALRHVLGNDDTVDALLANMQCKFFCQSSSTQTNAWASALLGERWVEVPSINVGRSGPELSPSSGVTRKEEHRRYVEPSFFTTLKRGGPANDFEVQCIVYNGGHLFAQDKKTHLPYALITFQQRK